MGRREKVEQGESRVRRLTRRSDVRRKLGKLPGVEKGRQSTEKRRARLVSRLRTKEKKRKKAKPKYLPETAEKRQG